MVKLREPPLYLTRVLRAVAEQRSKNGVAVNRIVKHIRQELVANDRVERNFVMHIRRALNYAVEIGALKHKAGKYRMVGKRKVYPVDTLELLMDSRSRKGKMKSSKKKATTSKKSTEDSEKRGASTQRNTKANLRIERKKSKSSEPTDYEDNDLNLETPDGPSDNNKNLDRKTSSSKQTLYPKYSDIMSGDERKSLQNVIQRPRRNRPPVLPSTNNQTDEASTERANTICLVITALLFLSIWHGLNQTM